MILFSWVWLQVVFQRDGLGVWHFPGMWMALIQMMEIALGLNLSLAIFLTSNRFRLLPYIT